MQENEASRVNLLVFVPILAMATDCAVRVICFLAVRAWIPGAALAVGTFLVVGGVHLVVNENRLAARPWSSAFPIDCPCSAVQPYRI
jgi:hypothetical protein